MELGPNQVMYTKDILQWTIFLPVLSSNSVRHLCSVYTYLNLASEALNLDKANIYTYVCFHRNPFGIRICLKAL